MQTEMYREKKRKREERKKEREGKIYKCDIF